MIPNTNDLLTSELNIETESSRTYKLNVDSDTINNYIDGLEAVKQAIYMILNTERYEHIIYSWNFGVELNDLYGEPINYVCSELERRISEALKQDERINNVENFNFEIKENKIKCTFNVNTIFGSTEIEKVVNI